MKRMQMVGKLLRQGRWSVVIVAAAAVLIGVSARTAAISIDTQPWGSRQLFVGIVSDSFCGAEHIRNGRGEAACTRLCVEQGADYALVSGGSLLVMKGHQADLNRFAGRTVLVMGAVRNNIVDVETVAPLYIPSDPIYTKYGVR